MPTDRVIHWQEQCPTEVEIEDALCRYVNASGRIEKPADRFMVTLIGGSKNPFPRAVDAEIFAPPFEVRMFEVYVDAKYVNVMTRQQDEFTSAVAEGFAAAIARKWNGRREGVEERS